SRIFRAISASVISSAISPTRSSNGDFHFDANPQIRWRTMATEPLLQFFETDHLRSDLAEVAAPCRDLAQALVVMLPRNPERTVALRHLLDAKTAAVRARLYREPGFSHRVEL